MRLAQIDTNLLVALDVLLQERHVTRAARTLGVTQSAMSQTLQRLRDTLGDPLLVRSGRKMVPTPFAEGIEGRLHAALRLLEQTVAKQDGFDARQDRRRFKLAFLDVYAHSVLPRLFRVIADAGEGLDVDVLPLNVDTIWDQLRNGEVELAITAPGEVPRDMRSIPFIDERMVSMVRADHPILNDPITTQSFIRWPHCVFRLTGRGNTAIDRRLAALGVSRRVVGRSPYFLAAPALIVDSDLIVSVPRTAARVFAERWPLALFDPPIGAPMTYTVNLAWPAYLDADTGNRWIRERMLEIADDMAALVAGERPRRLSPGKG